MTKLLLCGAAAAALLTIAPATAQTAPSTSPGHHGHMMKTETRADVQAHVERMFVRVDTDRDGFITKAELDAKLAQRAHKHGDRSWGRAGHFDPTKMFARFDANKDGQITRAEAEAAHNARVVAKGDIPAHAHALALGGLFERADANHDGVISKAEFNAAPKPQHPGMQNAGMHHGMGGRMLEMGDLNKDGRLSLAEAKQVALQHFDRADANHDGKLTPEERKQARELRHGQHKPS